MATPIQKKTPIRTMFVPAVFLVLPVTTSKSAHRMYASHSKAAPTFLPPGIVTTAIHAHKTPAAQAVNAQEALQLPVTTTTHAPTMSVTQKSPEAATTAITPTRVTMVMSARLTPVKTVLAFPAH